MNQKTTTDTLSEIPISELLTLVSTGRPSPKNFAARRELQHRFAETNGWKLSERIFSPTSLRDNRGCSREDYCGFDSSAMDHGESYTLGRRVICNVAHLYGPPGYDEEYAQEYGLVLHRAADPRGSWYYSGSARLVAYARPGTEVRWLT
jgi:hypothetical protein